MDPVEVRERQQTTRLTRSQHGIHRRAGSAVRSQWLAGGAVGDQFHRPEDTEATNLTDRWVLGRQPVQTRAEDRLADPRGIGDHALVLHGVDGRHRGRAGQRVSGVGEPTRVGPVGEGREDRVVDRHSAEGHIARRDTLGEGDQIRHHIEVLDGEPLSGSPESGHHLVGDEDDAVTVADLANTGQVTGRGDHDARRAGHRLKDDRRDGRRPLMGDETLKIVQRALGFLLLVLRVERRTVEEGAVEVDDAGGAVVAGIAARVPGQVDGGVGSAVIRAVPGEHLAPAGVQTGHPHGVLHGVGAGVGEEHMVQIAGRALGDQPRGLRPGGVHVLRGDRAQLGGLLGDRGDDLRMLVADVGEDQLPGEVQQPVALAVPDVGPFRRQHRHRRDLGLRRPRVEDVRPVQLIGAPPFRDGRLDVLAVGQSGPGGGHS